MPKVVKTREINIDLLRSLCIFAVVFIHSTASSMVENYPSKTSQTIFVLSIFTSCAVPLFYMLSGAFLINDKNTNYKKIINKAKKLFIQTIIWTLIYQLMFKLILKIDINIFETFVKSLTSSQVGHLWFMYPLLGIYMLLPFISKLYLSLKKKEKRYLILLSCIIPTIITTIKIRYDYMFSLPYFSLGFPEIGIFILGKYLYEYKDDYKSKIKMIFAILLFIIGAILIAYMGYYYIFNFGINHSKPYFDYNKLPNLTMLLGIIILFINIEEICKKIPNIFKKTINFIGSNTLGIYFIHMIYIYLFPTIKIGKIYFTSNSGNIFNMILGTTVYFILSITSVFILSHIPVIKKIIK